MEPYVTIFNDDQILYREGDEITEMVYRERNKYTGDINGYFILHMKTSKIEISDEKTWDEARLEATGDY